MRKRSKNEPEPAASNGRKAKHSSSSNEHYTPPEIVDAARNTMGQIDLDPASSAVANRHIQASKIFTKKNDGLLQEWHGTVFLNPPGGLIGRTSSAKSWWYKLGNEYEAGRVTQAIFLGFSLEILQTSQVKPLGPIPHTFPMCFPARRIEFLVLKNGVLVPGKDPTHANVIVYLPPKGADRTMGIVGFRDEFSCFGAVKAAD